MFEKGKEKKKQNDEVHTDLNADPLDSQSLPLPLYHDGSYTL